ncbi:MAG: M14 family metallopeptidase [Thiohalomonadales bacterium]|nr:M14 family metallopeptidase [Thiohalomonadales bacterium]
MTTKTMLQVLEQIPMGLLERDATRLHEVLAGPTLIHLSGQRPDTLFVSVLLHGNETTGWEAVRQLLNKYAGKSLPRTLSLFIGNIAAARHDQRHLSDQPDYNRIWKKDGDSPEHRMAQQVIEAISKLNLFASVDVHNNTGKNPHYACVNRLDQSYLHLANLFGRTVVYFIKPDTVMSMAMAPLCPAVTVECGQPGMPQGVTHVLDYLDACLHLSEFPAHPVTPHDLDLFHTVATVKVAAEMGVGFDSDSDDIALLPDIDRFNFNELPAGTAFGQVQHPGMQPFTVRDEQNRDVTSRYFEINGRWIQTRTPVMPSMLTRDLDIMKQDCLCYLMERFPLG